MIFIQQPSGQSQSVFGKLSCIERKDGRGCIGGYTVAMYVIGTAFQNVGRPDKGTVAHGHHEYFCGVLLVVTFGAQPANADSDVTFTISGVYSAATSSSQLSGPSDTFIMSFAVPSQPVTTDFLAGDDFFVDSPIQFSYSASNGGTASGLVFLSFYSLTSGSQPGGFFVDFCAGGPTCATGLEYQWEVPGSALYSGPESSRTLMPTSFDFTGGQFLVYD